MAHTNTDTDTNTECLTVREPWRQKPFSSKVQPQDLAISLSRVLYPKSKPARCSDGFYLHTGTQWCQRQICAFGSQHSHASRPSGGRTDAHTHPNTPIHTRSRSPSQYNNMENIRCCLFSMFYCWAMLGRSFVQSTSILIILVFYFSIISKEMLWILHTVRGSYSEYLFANKG